MRQSLFSRRIPTLLALLLLLGGLAATSYVANTSIPFISQASPDERPQEIRITNISDTSFTVTYTTAKSVIGAVSFGTTQPLTQTSLDVRDTSLSSSNTYQTHSIKVDSLKPSTTYLFAITSGVSEFLDSGKPFVVTTGPVLQGGDKKYTVTGSVLTLEGNPASDTLVYLTTNDAQVLSTMTDSSGKYTLSFPLLRSSSLTTGLTLTPDSTMNLIALSSTLRSQVTFRLTQDKLPPITLSENYDFTFDENPVEDAGSDSASLQFPVLPANPVENTNVAVDVPQNEERFTDQQPSFEGKASPNETVEISIQSELQKATITADNSGNWSYRPEKPLAPGEHTITVKTRDDQGLLRAITRKFVVLAEGSQFTEPSISPAVSISPSVTPTKIPSISPTQATSPTVTVKPSETAALITTAPTKIVLPTLDPTPTISPRPSVEPTGSSTLTTMTLFSFAIIGFGAILLLFTKGIRL